MDLKAFCHSLPKVELHAHLNGSLSKNTLKKLHKLQNPDGEVREDFDFDIDNLSSLSECFKAFDIAHSLTDTPEAMFVSALDVIREFNEDNVIYLELRSTPREVEGKMSKQEYVESIIKAMVQCETDFPDIIVRLLISVNRKYGFEAAKENVELAIDFAKKYPKFIVGIDLSGDPMTGDAFIELLKTARFAGLKISAHCAEVPNEIETIDILNFKPDRLGHCTCIHPNLGGSQKLFDMLEKSKIPVELCPTSNLKSKTVPSYAAHQFKYYYEAGHPICISTDDKGVFGTTLSKEYEIIATTFQLKKDDIKKLCLSPAEYIFATIQEKDILLSKMNSIISAIH